MISWKRVRHHPVTRRVFYYATHYTWAFAAVMAVTLLSTLFSIFYLAHLEADLKDLYENDVRGGDSVQTAYTALLGLESAVKNLVVFPDKRNQALARAEIKTRSATLKAAMNTAAPRFYTPRAKQALANSKEHLKEFLKALDGILTLHSAGRKLDAASLTRFEERSAVLQKDFDLLVANRIANSSIGVKDLIGQLRLSLIVTIVLLVVTVAVRLVLYVAGHPRLQRKTGKPERDDHDEPHSHR